MAAEESNLATTDIEPVLSAIKEALEGNVSARINISSSHHLYPLAVKINEFLDSLETKEAEQQNYVDSLLQSIIELRGAYEELTTLQLLSVTINATFEKEEVLNIFINLLHEVIDYQACCLLQIEGTQFVVASSRNLSVTLEQGIRQSSTQQLLQWCCKESKVVPLGFKEFVGDAPGEGQEGLSYLAIPITFHNKTLGALLLECDDPGIQFTQQQLTLVSILAAQTGTACENAELYKDMKQKNMDLAYLKNYLQNILEQVTTGIITLDKQGRITMLNKMAERIFNLSAEEAEGKPFYNIFTAPLRSSMRHLVMSTMLNEEVSNFDVEYPAPDNKKISSLTFSTSLLKEENDTVLGFVIACRDITELKELDAIKKLSQLKSEFLSNISHELRTPLTSIKAYSETLLTRHDRMPPEMQLDCLSIIDSESDRLARLLDDLLDFSRMEAGKLKLKKEWMDIQQLVLSTIEEMKMQTSRHNIQVTLQNPPERIMADRDRIKQALINLVSNAIKYSPQGGNIVCAVEGKVQEVVVGVSDQGIGIDEEHLPHIFEKFYRVEGPLSYQISGTGLGLPITKAIIEAHGGSIWAASRPGQGTTISFSLPIDSV